MAWQVTPYMILLLVSAAISAAAAVYVRLRHPTPGSKAMILVALAGIVWLGGYALELGSTDVLVKDFWNKVQYVGIVVVPTAWLAFILQYTGHEKWLTRRNLLLLSVEPIVTLLLVFTNQAHGWIWEHPLSATVLPFSRLARAHGAGYWVHAAYTYALLLIVIWLLIQMFVRSRHLYRRQASLLLIATLLPLVASGLMQFGLNALSYLDLTPLAFTLSLLILMWNLFHLQRESIASVLRGAILRSMGDGVIVLDAQNRIVDLNQAAQLLVAHPAAKVIGRPVEQVWPGWPIRERHQDMGEVVEEVVKDGKYGRRIYDVRFSPLTDWRDRLVGQVAVLRDITELKQRTMELSALLEVTRAASSTLALEEALTLVAEQLARVVGVDGCTLSRWDQETDTVITWVRWHHQEQELADEPGTTNTPDDFPAIRTVLKTRRPVVCHISDPDADPAQVVYLCKTQKASLLILPLVIEDQAVGLVELDQYEHKRDFTVDEIRLCQALADQAAGIIESTWLYEDAKRRAGELAVLNKTGQAIASTLDLDVVLDQAMTEAKAIVDAESASVLLRDPVKDELMFATIVGPAAETLIGTHMPTTEGIAGWVVQTGQPVLVRDVQSDPRFYDQIDMTTGLTTHSLLAVPLKYKDKIIGVIEVINKTDGYFDEHDRDLLSALAGFTAVAIENARLYEETARRLAETRVLKEIMRVAASTLDFDQILERTIETLQAMMKVEFIGFALLDEEGKGLWLHPAQVGFPPLPEGFRLPLDKSICGQVFQTGTPILTGNVREVPHYYESVPEVCSELAVPVLVGGHVIGVLNVESRRPNDFEEDEAFYMAIAGQLGVALENARLYQEVCRQTDELTSAVVRLRELDRLKGEFVQNVSHELRTPLALMRGYAEVLSMGELGELQPEQQEPMDIIARRARMLTELVGDITLIMEVETNPPKPEPVSLDALTWAAVEDLKVAAAHTGLTLQAEIAPDLPSVYCTPTYLRRVLNNLVDNAIKFTPEGGTITVRLRQEDGQVALEVRDTGIGIPDDQLERIFERFYQIDGSTSRRYGGVGLGLALVKEIVEAYNGRVTVQSRTGEGSAFIVTLPVFQEVGDAQVL